MPDDRPPFILRLAVVVGGVSLLLGIVAAVSLVVQGEEPGPVAGPGMWARVRIEGAPPGVPLEVAVTWNEADATITQRARRLEGGSDVWILPPCPEGVLVTILVRNPSTSPPDVLGSERVEVRPGMETRVDVTATKNG